MRSGWDRYAPGYPDGTRHPCPYCDWYLDSEPLSAAEANAVGEVFMDALSLRLDTINAHVQDHIASDHPTEFKEARTFQVDRTG